jgi:hypothetical protein
MSTIPQSEWDPSITSSAPGIQAYTWLLGVNACVCRHLFSLFLCYGLELSLVIHIHVSGKTECSNGSFAEFRRDTGLQ